MLSCYVVDDEPHSVAIIVDYIQQTAGLTLAGSSSDPVQAISELRTLDNIDILFSDIEMPKVNGLELAGLISPNCIVVFMTAHPDYALQAYELDAFAYLLKPVNYARFIKVIERILSHRAQPSPQKTSEALYMKGDAKGKILRITLNDIVYIESAQNYIQVATERETFTSYMMISEMSHHLPENQFSRVHRSFIINHDYISYFTNNTIVMKNQVHIPLSQKYRDGFTAKIAPRMLFSERLLP